MDSSKLTWLVLLLVISCHGFRRGDTIVLGEVQAAKVIATELCVSNGTATCTRAMEVHGNGRIESLETTIIETKNGTAQEWHVENVLFAMMVNSTAIQGQIVESTTLTTQKLVVEGNATFAEKMSVHAIQIEGEWVSNAPSTITGTLTSSGGQSFSGGTTINGEVLISGDIVATGKVSTQEIVVGGTVLNTSTLEDVFWPACKYITPPEEHECMDLLCVRFANGSEGFVQRIGDDGRSCQDGDGECDNGHCILLNPQHMDGGGVHHQCFATQTGRLRCIGSGGNGQLGQGTTDIHTQFVEVPGLSDVKHVTHGRYTTGVVTSSGDLYMFGRNNAGQVGIGTTSEVVNTPQHVLDGVDKVRCGGSFCIARLLNGSFYSWGANSDNQLGRTDTIVPYIIPGSIGLVSSVVDWSVGYFHTCIVLEDGVVQCWGYGQYGQLGRGSFSSSLYRVNVTGLSDAVQVSCGIYHTCARHEDGKVSCWGYGGRLGNGNDNDANVPQMVVGITDAVDIASQATGSCAVVGSHSVYCWSDVVSTNPIAPQGLVPSVVPHLGAVDTLFGSKVESRMCAKLFDGTVFCWGNNVYQSCGCEYGSYYPLMLPKCTVTLK